MLTAGTAVLIAFDVYDIDGGGNKILADATSVALTITRPDGTTETPTVANPPTTTGKYRHTYLPTQEGHHEWAAVTTVPNTSYADSFDVRAYHSMLSLAEAKTHLGMTSTSDDEELRNFLQAATEVVETKVGPCARRQVTQRITDGGRQIVLAHRPVLSVTSVTSVWPGGPSWATADIGADSEAGIIYLTVPAAFWYGPWDVTYVAGRAVIPERYLHAAKEQLRHLWETQRGSQQAPPLAGEETFTTSAGWAFSVPRRVLELLEDGMVPAV